MQVSHNSSSLKYLMLSFHDLSASSIIKIPPQAAKSLIMQNTDHYAST